VPSENQLHWLCRPRSYEQPTQIVLVENENMPCPLNGDVIFRAYMVVVLPDRTLGHDKRWHEEFLYSFLRKRLCVKEPCVIVTDNLVSDMLIICGGKKSVRHYRKTIKIRRRRFVAFFSPRRF
jgi:hypothetical protein